jgi:hypothetical protein
MRLENPMPEGLDDIAADIFHNLRSALDQAGYATAIANNKSGGAAYYPFGDNAVEVASRRTGASKEIPSEIFNVMESFKPYKGGNDLLWTLNKMRNHGEHRITCAVGKAVGNHSIFFFQKHGPIETGMVVSMPPVIWEPGQQEVEFLRIGRSGDGRYRSAVNTFLTFSEFEPIRGKIVEEVLNALIALVNGILTAIEIKATECGLFVASA